MVKSKDADFEESKHKRDEGGKFSAGGHAAAAAGHEARVKAIPYNSEQVAHQEAATRHREAETAYTKSQFTGELREKISQGAHEASRKAAAATESGAKKSSTTAVNNTLGSMRGHAGYLRELEHGQAFTHRPNAETGKFDRMNSHEAAERTLKNARELHGFVHTNSSDPKHHEAATKTLKNLEKLAEKVKAREPYSK